MQTMKKLFLILSVAAGLVSCEDFLTAGDPNKIDAPSYFRNESDLEAYANGFLQTMIPTAISVATGDARADYMAWRGEWQYLTDNFDADDQSGWSTGSWEDLRNINYFLCNFRRAAAVEAILDHYEGVARFWRAYFYMNKVKTFGAVPWYDREIDANDREALYKPRDSREYVMRKVLEDLDFASTHCITNAKLEVNSVRITRNVALAFKARCCLYEGTFRKYHANDPSTGKPWTADESEMYLRACADACETLMGEGKYALVSDPAKVVTQYRSLFTSESVASGEVIWARAYDASLNATHILNTYFVNMQYGSTAASAENARYIPGIYTSTISLGDQTFDVQVNVEQDRITAISLNNLSETTAAMYPLMEPALDSIASQIYVNQTTEGLIYGEDDRYTSELLVSAINQALEQAQNPSSSES